MRNPTRNVNDHVVLSRRKAELIKAFESAKSVDGTLKAFKEMEACFDESDLGMECWIVAQGLVNEGRAHEEALRFGSRALRILIGNKDNNIPCFGKYSSGILNDGTTCTHCQKSSFFISCVCHLLGSICLELKRYDESLSYLNWANRNLSKLEEEDNSPCTGNCVLHGILDTQLQLFGVKIAKGRHGEAAPHMRKILEVKEKMMEEGCIELGEANMNVYNVYCAAEDFEAALPFCLKALEIHTKHLGRNSVVVAQIRRSLGIIYKQLGEYEKALEQNQLSLSVLKNMCSNSSDLLMELVRYEEAIDVLKGEVSRNDIEGDSRAFAFLSMAKAFVKLGKFADAKKRMRTAQRILEKKGRRPLCVATGFGEMSSLYEEMNDPETALSFIRRAMEIPDLPQTLLSQYASRLFSLTSQSGKVKEGIPYMEDVVEKLKERFGPEHCEVGYGYAHLGVAYMESCQHELALKFMKNAKDIMDATIGPNHLDSLTTSQTFAITYADMGSYDQAMEIQEKVVEGLKGLGPSKQEFLDEAVMHLNEIKEGVAKSSTSDSPRSEDGEDLSERISKCGISDDGKEIK